jgi:hypothetical protein
MVLLADLEMTVQKSHALTQLAGSHSTARMKIFNFKMSTPHSTPRYSSPGEKLFVVKDGGGIKSSLGTEVTSLSQNPYVKSA